MFEAVERNITEIRQLALDPTPSNYDSITARLQSFVEFLNQPAVSEHSNLPRDAKALEGFHKLRAEMASLQTLLQYPLTFYRGLSALRAREFGAYERSGSFRSLELEPAGKTLIHL